MTDYNINISLKQLADSIKTSLTNYINNLPVSVEDEPVYTLISEAKYCNPWFSQEHMVFALRQFTKEVEYLSKHINPVGANIRYRNIGVLLRNNAPMEGIAELLFLAVSGCTLQVIAAPELKDYFSKVVKILNTEFQAKGRIFLNGEVTIKSSTQSSGDGFGNSDAIIAFSELNDTLSGYLKRFPVLGIYRKGESLVLTGEETDAQLAAVAELVCMYYGRASGNVRVLFVPGEYDLSRLVKHLEVYSEQLFHNKYFNNFEYRKAGMLINRIPQIVMGPVIITEDSNQAGYTGVLCVQRYRQTIEISANPLLNLYPLKQENAEDIDIELLRLSVFSENIENISGFILQD